MPTDIRVQMAMMEKALQLLSSANLELNDQLESSQCLKPLEALALLELSQYVCNTYSNPFSGSLLKASREADSRLVS
jgi:hypothetical protein